jgi:hypothetical protein
MTSLCDSLIDGITDPLDNRTGEEKWIIVGKFYQNHPDQTPKVYLSMENELPGPMYQGSGARTFNLEIQIEIRIREGQKAMISNVEYSDQLLLLTIIDQIINHIHTNEKIISNIDFIYRTSAGKCRYEEHTKSWYARPKFIVQVHQA